MSSLTPKDFISYRNPSDGDSRLRRRHRKSRHGCLECKKRHVKCDETRPCCVNCVTSNRDCVYLSAVREIAARFAPKPSTESAPRENAGATTPQERGSTPSSLSGPESTSPDDGHSENITAPLHHQLFTLEHLSLLHHFEHNRAAVLMTNELSEPTSHLSLEAALAAPYLMDVILAHSAFHLATLSEDKARHYQLLATQLQARSLGLFNDAYGQPTEATCIPLFYFSSLLGVQVLHQALQSNRDDFPSFLTHFAKYLHIHRGVSVIAVDWWHIIRQTLSDKLINLVEGKGGEHADTSGGDECDPLHDMLSHSDLNAASIEVCRDATKLLQTAFKLYHRLAPLSKHRTAGAMSFPVHIAPEFVEMVSQQKPEALVILAFYAVLLHRCRDAWAVQDGGSFMIKSIADRLQGYWSKWLVFPVSVVDTIEG